MKYFPYFSQKTVLDILCKLSPVETICMKCQILFPAKNIINLSSAEFTQKVVMVKELITISAQPQQTTFSCFVFSIFQKIRLGISCES